MDHSLIGSTAGHDIDSFQQLVFGVDSIIQDSGFDVDLFHVNEPSFKQTQQDHSISLTHQVYTGTGFEPLNDEFKLYAAPHYQ